MEYCFKANNATFLENYESVKAFKWHDFDTDIEVPKRDDPMRKWTTTVAGKNETIVGTGQIINQTILEIQL